MPAYALLDSIQECYNLNDYVRDRLVLTYNSWSRPLKTKYTIHIGSYEDEEDEYYSEKPLLGDRMIRTQHGEYRKLTLADLTLQVRTLKDDLVLKDTTCDSEFMLEMTEELGEAIRKAYHWVPRSETVHLFMDNAGGHGTELAKMQYVDILKTHYNVEVCWQVSNSPETNILDLGVWCLLQSLVEYLHRNRRMNEDSLSRTIEQAWGLVDGYTKFKSVVERWKKVLSLIILGKGGNSLVEKCRGLQRSLDDITIPLADGDEVLDDVDDCDGDCNDHESNEILL